MSRHNLKQTIGLVIFSAWATAASAQTFKLSFIATAFKPHSDQTTVSPPEVLAGSFLFAGNLSELAPITLIDVDLEVEGYRYSPGEIGTRYFPEDGTVIFGGTQTGVAGVMNRTNDFFLSYPFRPAARSYLLYSTVESQGFSYTEQVTYSLSQVPEPTGIIFGLVGASLIVSLATARRRAVAKT